MPKASSSLADFAATYTSKRGPQCWGCSLKETEEIAQEYQKGIGPSVIQNWLIEKCGYSTEQATRSRIASHLRAHVTRIK